MRRPPLNDGMEPGRETTCKPKCDHIYQHSGEGDVGSEFQRDWRQSFVPPDGAPGPAFLPMSDDTLSELVADAIADAIAHRTAAVLTWAYAVLAAVVAGTVWIVTMVHDVRGSIREAHREAGEARAALTDLQVRVAGHERSIVVLDSWMKWRGGGE